MKSVDMSHSKGVVIRNQVILFAAAISHMLLSVIITVFLGRNLTPAAYGFFTLTNTIFFVARDLINFGTDNVAAREIILNPSEERDILESLMGWRRISALIIALIVFGFALRQDDSYRMWVLCSAAFVLCFMHVNALNPTFQIRQRQGGPAMLTLGAQLSLLIACVCMSICKAVGGLFAFLVVIREAINMAGIYVMASKLLGYRPRAGLRGKNLKVFFGKTLHFGLASMIYKLYYQNGTFFVWLLRNKDELGAYSAAFRPVSPFLNTLWIMVIPLVPVFTNAAKQDRSVFLQILEETLYLSIGFGTIVSVAGYFLAPDLIWLLYSGNYLSDQLSAISTFRWFSLTLCFAYITPILAMALLAVGKESILLLLSMLGLILNLIANFLLVPKLGFYSAAMTTAITELIVCMGCLFFFKEDLIKIFSNLPILFFVPAISIAIIIPILPFHHFQRLICGCGMVLLGMLLILKSPSAKRYRRVISSTDYMRRF